jgi:hypothetical protein
MLERFVICFVFGVWGGVSRTSVYVVESLGTLINLHEQYLIMNRSVGEETRHMLLLS